MSTKDPDTSIVLIGAGAIGSALLPLVSALRPGAIRIVDGDTVEEANLPRQLLYGPEDVGRLKAEVAADRIRALALDTEVQYHPNFLDDVSGHEILVDATIVLDCTDDLNARLLIDRLCSALNIPVVIGSVHRQQVQVLTVHVPSAHGATAPTWRSFFPDRTAEEQDGCLMQEVPGDITVMAAAVMARHVRALMNADHSMAGVLELIDTINGSWLRVAAPTEGDQDLIATGSLSVLQA